MKETAALKALGKAGDKVADTEQKLKDAKLVRRAALVEAYVDGAGYTWHRLAKVGRLSPFTVGKELERAGVQLGEPGSVLASEGVRKVEAERRRKALARPAM